jgi:DNA-binding Lrp family transcriptional regulator
MAAELDKIDLQILKILQENGRITNLQLSNEIGLSPAPTLERVRKLENAEYIKSYHALGRRGETWPGYKNIYTDLAGFPSEEHHPDFFG